MVKGYRFPTDKRCAFCGSIHCYWCGRTLHRRAQKKGHRELDPTREHLIPRSWRKQKGHRLRGLQTGIATACVRCNTHRGNEDGGKSPPWIPFHDHEIDRDRMPFVQRSIMEGLV